MPKRGDIHPVTGLVYWSTCRGRQIWRTAETVARWRAQQKASVDRWQKADPVRHRAAQSRFRAVHGKRRNADARGYRNKWKKDRRKTDPIYALKVALSSRFRLAIKRKGLRKQNRALRVLGCTAAFLRKHIESQFKSGMSWGNYGVTGWHIDHKFPLATAQTLSDIERLCHYTNLQPLWWYENLAKGSKILAA